MSSRSNEHGRAYEYACLMNLESQVSKIRSCVLVRNSCFYAAQKAWNTLSDADRHIYETSSLAAVFQIFAMEPRITEVSDDSLELLIQPDSEGKSGDVRDILIVRNSITWEIGLSLKHNHFAVKHSRLSSQLDFGKTWYSIPCSENYWNAVNPVFKYLAKEKASHSRFCDLPDKENDVYIPILKAFIDELTLQSDSHKDMPARMVEYLMGKYDFYKIISIDKEKLTRIQALNMHGTLNLPSKEKSAEIEVPVVALPTRIVHIDFVPDSNNTVEVYMDGGWQFTFRIHNAATYVEPSLKFDIQMVGMPTAILTINCIWK